MLDVADTHMRNGRHREALTAYQEAWAKLAGGLDSVQQIWLLLSIANSAVRCSDFDEAFEALAGLSEHFADSGVVVGNPLFHLLVGLAYYGLNEDRDAQTDNFARALICGGQEIFAMEDPKHLRQIKKILQPPAETGSWDGYQGCSRDLLNGATGYLRDLLSQKFGNPPPYG